MLYKWNLILVSFEQYFVHRIDFKVTREDKLHAHVEVQGLYTKHYIDSMYILLRMPFKVHSVPSFVIFFARVKSKSTVSKNPKPNPLYQKNLGDSTTMY